MFPNSALLAIRASLNKQYSFFFLSGISKLLQYKSILSSEQKHTLKHNIHHKSNWLVQIGYKSTSQGERNRQCHSGESYAKIKVVI